MPIFKKDIVDTYENGKHRRYSLLFAVNDAILAIGKFLADERKIGSGDAEVLGGLQLGALACGMIFFTIVMIWDILPIELEQVTQLSREAAGHDWRRLAWHLP